MKIEKWLPLGSVVILKNGSKPLMIFGRKQINVKTQKEFDYVGCLWPEGNIASDFNFFFNNEDIGKVLFRGFENEVEIEFRKMLK
uniref:DUF4176 domain-containing protein n=1 Tax=Caldicellulosiruptor owensensis TaxID=55205 RepID=A0A7C5Z361_9FIRM